MPFHLIVQLDILTTNKNYTNNKIKKKKKKTNAQRSV